MVWAFLNDVMQRILTFNKLEQRNNLLNRVKSIPLTQGSKILDFGCGTGLFASVFERHRFNYWGYDIDNRLTSYANLIYRRSHFSSFKADIKREAPFDLILANCCFHHMDDATILQEISEIDKLLHPKGTFIIIDILLALNDPSFMRNMYRRMECGAYIRSLEGYRKILQGSFSIRKSGIEISHLFSLKCIPIWNSLAVFECEKK